MRLSLFILLVCLISSCHSEKSAVNTLENYEIHFGSSGGMANVKDEYFLAPDGKLYHQQNKNPKKLITTLSEKKAHSIIAEALELHIDKMDMKHAGNMTYFIIVTNGKESNEISWGEANFTVPENIKAYYDKLYKLRP